MGLSGVSHRFPTGSPRVPPGVSSALPQEKVFTALAWTPKATVQAALGGLALDAARSEEEERRLGGGGWVIWAIYWSDGLIKVNDGG